MARLWRLAAIQATRLLAHRSYVVWLENGIMIDQSAKVSFEVITNSTNHIKMCYKRFQILDTLNVRFKGKTDENMGSLISWYVYKTSRG